MFHFSQPPSMLAPRSLTMFICLQLIRMTSEDRSTIIGIKWRGGGGGERNWPWKAVLIRPAFEFLQASLSKFCADELSLQNFDCEQS